MDKNFKVVPKSHNFDKNVWVCTGHQTDFFCTESRLSEELKTLTTITIDLMTKK